MHVDIVYDIYKCLKIQFDYSTNKLHKNGLILV